MFAHVVPSRSELVLPNETILTPCGKWRRYHRWSFLSCKKCLRINQKHYAELIEQTQYCHTFHQQES